MGRNGIRKRINRMDDEHNDEPFMISKRTYAYEILSGDHPEDNADQVSVYSQLDLLRKQGGPKLQKQCFAGALASFVYHTWSARNAIIFQQVFADINVHAEQMKKEIQADCS